MVVCDRSGNVLNEGTPLNATGAFNFTITNFTVTASANNQAIGQTYNSFYPPQGFLWNGGQVTQFYHNNDLDTVLSYFSVYIDLFPSDYREFEYYFSDYFSAGTGDFYVREGGSLQYSADGPLTLTLSSSAVPEIDPAGIGSVLTLVAGALGLVERRRLASV